VYFYLGGDFLTLFLLSFAGTFNESIFSSFKSCLLSYLVSDPFFAYYFPENSSGRL